ncbi:MAG: hypothetical protein ACLUN1_17715 [Odoribacter splanchnicus]
MLQVGADALASKTVYPVNPQAQQQIALIGREIPDFCYRDSTGKEVKFSSSGKLCVRGYVGPGAGLVVRRFLIWANWKRNFTVRKSVCQSFL